MGPNGKFSGSVERSQQFPVTLPRPLRSVPVVAGENSRREKLQNVVVVSRAVFCGACTLTLARRSVQASRWASVIRCAPSQRNPRRASYGLASADGGDGFPAKILGFAAEAQELLVGCRVFLHPFDRLVVPFAGFVRLPICWWLMERKNQSTPSPPSQHAIDCRSTSRIAA